MCMCIHNKFYDLSSLSCVIKGHRSWVSGGDKSMSKRRSQSVSIISNI